MTCAECREALSARLDGEEHPGERSAVDSHLAGCSGCRAFAERAALVTRLARTDVVEPMVDVAEVLSEEIDQLGRKSAWPRWTTLLRALLAAVGLGQLGLAVDDIVVAASHEHHDIYSLSGASLAHLAHESSAWNLALAVGFLGVAIRPSRLRGVLSLVGAFVGVLATLSVLDLLGGRVEGSRLLSHGLVVLGLLALLGLARLGEHPSDGAPRTGQSWRRFDEETDHAPSRTNTPPVRRHSAGRHDLKPSARRAAA